MKSISDGKEIAVKGVVDPSQPSRIHLKFVLKPLQSSQEVRRFISSFHVCTNTPSDRILNSSLPHLYTLVEIDVTDTSYKSKRETGTYKDK